MSRKQAIALAFSLTDTGPLVALINVNDPYHTQARDALRRLPKVPMLTTWPCITEAMYLLHQAGGYAAQEELWRFISHGLLHLHQPDTGEQQRMRELMAIYRDSPMDFADASLVAAAEALSLQQVFTFDRHFYAYRLLSGSALELIA